MASKDKPTIDEEIQDRQRALDDLHEQIDKAIEDGDTDSLKDAQANLAANSLLLSSAQRRKQREMVRQAEERRLQELEKNKGAERTLVSCIEEDIKHAKAVSDAASSLVDAVQVMLSKERVDNTVSAMEQLLRGIPVSRRMDRLALCDHISGADRHIFSILVNLLRVSLFPEKAWDAPPDLARVYEERFTNLKPTIRTWKTEADERISA